MHHVATEMKRGGGASIPSFLHQENHTAVISLAALQRRGYCLDSCSVLRLMPNVPFFLSLGLADLMTDSEGKSLDPIPVTVAQATRASLKRIIGHLTTVADGAFSLPAAPADGTGGHGALKLHSSCCGPCTVLKLKSSKACSRSLSRYRAPLMKPSP